MNDERLIGIAAALGSAASWAVGAILFKKLGEFLSPIAMTLSKGVVSVVFLGVFVALTGFNALSAQDWCLLIASGIIGIALGDTLFFAALRDLGPQTLIVLLMIGQVLTVLLAFAFLHERPTAFTCAGIAAVILGVGIVLWANLSGEISPTKGRGILLGFLSIACMSISVIIAKEGLEKASAMQAAFTRMAAGMTGVALFGVATRQVAGWVRPFQDLRLMRSFVMAVCVVTFGGFWLSLVSIKHLDVSVANTLGSTEPIFVLPLAALILREKIVPAAVVGTLISVAGIVAIFMTHRAPG